MVCFCEPKENLDRPFEDGEIEKDEKDIPFLKLVMKLQAQKEADDIRIKKLSFENPKKHAGTIASHVSSHIPFIFSPLNVPKKTSPQLYPGSIEGRRLGSHCDEKIEEGGVVSMRSITLQKKDEYRIMKDNAYLIELNGSTSVRKATTNVGCFVRHPFHLMEFEDIQPTEKIDVIGMWANLHIQRLG
ncbi:hypothetical protein Tco_0998497 [Tanacetum coccineum]